MKDAWEFVEDRLVESDCKFEVTYPFEIDGKKLSVELVSNKTISDEDATYFAKFLRGLLPKCDFDSAPVYTGSFRREDGFQIDIYFASNN